jgi:hypothetical protein
VGHDQQSLSGVQIGRAGNLVVVRPYGGNHGVALSEPTRTEPLGAAELVKQGLAPWTATVAL